MAKKRKYRVRVDVTPCHHLVGWGKKVYIIQKHEGFILGWSDHAKPTENKRWAYDTCEEMNASYEEMLTKIKNK